MLFEQTPVGQAPSRSAPSKTDSAETMWTGLLALIRALILGRRLPPDQLRMFLLFAPPVDYLSPREVAELLNWRRDFSHKDNRDRWVYWGPEFDEEIPEDWTIAFALYDPDEESYASRWDTQMFAGSMTEALAEHPEWSRDWKVFHADNGAQMFGYRVLDERHRVHPIACWMEGRRKMLREGELEVSEEVRRRETLEFLAYSVEWMFESIDDQLAQGDLDGEDSAAVVRLVNTVKPVNDLEVAEWIYDHEEWDVDDYMGPQTYIGAIDKACAALGYYGPGVEYHAPAANQKKLFAA